MPIDVIAVNQTSAEGSELVNAKNALANVQQQFAKVLEQMQNMTDFANWATLESEFGLVAGSGSITYGLVFAVANDSGTNNGILFSPAALQLIGQIVP